jgi:hypothetical protein
MCHDSWTMVEFAQGLCLGIGNNEAYTACGSTSSQHSIEATLKYLIAKNLKSLAKQNTVYLCVYKF